MKIRDGFVTNSSSSSFIINKSDVSKDKLIEILVELANKYYEYYWLDEEDDDGHRPEWDEETQSVSNYYLIEATPDHPYKYNDYDWFSIKPTSYSYDDHWVVDNDGSMRYDWDLIDEILEKHNLDWKRGYCD